MLRRLIGLPLAPVMVKVPLVCWVVPAVKRKILPAVVQVKSLKVWLPEMIEVWVVLKITSLLPALKVLTFQFLPTVMF